MAWHERAGCLRKVPDATASEQLAFVLQTVEARKMKPGPGPPSRGEEESQ